MAKETAKNERNIGAIKWSDEKIAKVLSRQNAMVIRINDKLGEMQHPFVALLLIDSSEYAEIKNCVVEKFENEFSVIYISMNAGYAAAKKDAQKHGRDISRIFFIDMVSREAGTKQEKAKNAVYLSSPLDLTECMLSVDGALARNGAAKPVIMLDSVSSMLIYADPRTVEKFVHSLVVKANAADASAVMFSPGMEKQDSVTGTIGQFFERIIRI